MIASSTGGELIEDAIRAHIHKHKHTHTIPLPFLPSSFLSLRPSKDLIDFAWGAREIHCGSVRPFGSVACVRI